MELLTAGLSINSQKENHSRQIQLTLPVPSSMILKKVNGQKSFVNCLILISSLYQKYVTAMIYLAIQMLRAILKKLCR